MNRRIVNLVSPAGRHTTKNPEETALVAQKLARTIVKKGVQKHAVVVGLSGELGAGKTTFVKAFAKELGIKETVVSPTFILERIYLLPKKNPFTHLVHIDAYRLKGESELPELGWDTLVSHPNNIMIIEWAEKIEKVLPQNAIKISFEHKGKEKREMKLSYGL